MGAQQSALVVNRLQQRNIDDLLKDHEFLEWMGEAIPSLSKESASNLHDVVVSGPKSRRERSQLQTGKLKPLLSLTPNDVVLPSTLSRDIIEYQSNWIRLFWDSPTSAPDAGNLASLPTLSTIYEAVLYLEKRTLMDRVRWRFFAMFFYDLHNLINNRVNVTSRGFRAIAEAINRLTDYADEVEHNLRSWISRGRRYRNISDALGSSGCLFLLPESISDYLWEESLPLRGPAFAEAIQRLGTLGIRQKAEELGCAQLGASIERGLIECCKWQVNSPQTFSVTSSAASEDVHQSRYSSTEAVEQDRPTHRDPMELFSGYGEFQISSAYAPASTQPATAPDYRAMSGEAWIAPTGSAYYMPVQVQGQGGAQAINVATTGFRQGSTAAYDFDFMGAGRGSG